MTSIYQEPAFPPLAVLIIWRPEENYNTSHLPISFIWILTHFNIVWLHILILLFTFESVFLVTKPAYDFVISRFYLKLGFSLIFVNPKNLHSWDPVFIDKAFHSHSRPGLWVEWLPLTGHKLVSNKTWKLQIHEHFFKTNLLWFFLYSAQTLKVVCT